MKIRGLVLIVVAVAFAFAPAKLNAQGNYAVKLTSPVTGQVLYAGQKIMIEWKHMLPNIPLGGVRARLGCRWMAAGVLPCGLRFSTRGIHLSSGLFRTRRPTRRSWTSASGVTCITPKATPHSLHRPL